MWVPDRDCNAIPIPIRYYLDTIPWDRITLSDPIPYSIPGIEKSIRSDTSADTVSDRICFTVGGTQRTLSMTLC
ncbi:Kinesin-like protein kif20a [Puccinia graminis f. sp. tritici]|uniref:Kinesin-like protein kif20a n=1 Tax=Puccinia graminis f. sp. tritici TaxID=56615 RepID=A0A5B0LNZ9_PUCGR|nr:Kinesin-like protein kif20a [Puccinia graminis f. sp. tritici]KAA1079951.1 Kinesin-like protein kif20a [Puccinia graminis f. sp. tritici]